MDVWKDVLVWAFVVTAAADAANALNLFMFT